jgi:hypothetical protein
MNKKLVLGLILLFLLLSSISIASAQLTVGVKNGDWIQYQVTYTGTPDPSHAIAAAKMDILNVQGTTIKVNILSTYSNGTQISTDSTLNLQTGQLIDNFIIPANLTKGDQFYDSNVGNITIAGVEEKTYAGATRTVINATSGDNTYIWDQATGISVEGISLGSDYTMHTFANETNIWQSQIAEISKTNINLLAIVGATSIIVLGVLSSRNKKIKR